jgi:regulator of replication initiation timing
MNTQFLNASVPTYAPQTAFFGGFECNMTPSSFPLYHYNMVIRNLVEENQKLNKELIELRKTTSQQSTSKASSEPSS